MTSRNAWLAGLALALLLSGSALRAQQGRRDASSDLARENLERVAASASEIEAVLRREPGLLVELKRWVAKEAADHGQIVSDAELADRAIYARLAMDLKFRSVATQLLERYGYLVAQVNPKSELGLERQLVLQARANQIAQAQERQSRMGTTPGIPGTQQSSQTGNGCVAAGEPNREQVQSFNQGLDEYESADQDCTPRQPRAPSRQELETYASAQASTGASAAFKPHPPDFDQDNSVAPLQNLPFPSGQQGMGSTDLMQTRMGAVEGAAQVPFNSSAGGISTYLGGSNLEYPTDLPGSREANLAELGTPPNSSSGGSGHLNPPPRTNEGMKRRLNPALVRRPNPYADIPSLYDMYQQASPRPAQLERFGMDVFENTNLNPDYLPTDLPVGPDYVLGPGDGLMINLWGGVARRLYRTVDREGRVSLPEAGPVLVSGHSMGEVQEEIQQVLRTQFRDVSADVSLSRSRTLRHQLAFHATECPICGRWTDFARLTSTGAPISWQAVDTGS